MLNNIFSQYSKSSKLSKNEEDKKSSNKNNIFNEDFLNENENLSMNTKCDEVMKKYCTLYKDEEDETTSNNNKYSIKPLNHRYLEQKDRRVEHSKTTGEGWFNMKAPELTPELKEDLKTIQLRHIIDPSRFYKKLDRNNLPKFFQIGTILDNIVDGKKNRLKKEDIKSRIAEEFLELDKEKNYSLRKFEEFQDQRRKLGLKKSKLNKYKT